MNYRPAQLFIVLACSLMLSIVSPTVQAGNDACGLTKRIRYANDVGNDSLNDVFASAQSIEKRNFEIRGAIRAGKCEIIKLAKVSKWKEALGVLRKSSGSNSEVALAASKFLKSLPSTKTLSKLSSDAKALDKKYKSMPGTQPKENFAKDYAKNTKLLPKTIAASVSFQIRVPALKNKLNKIIAKHGG